jgi:transcriptional regulator with XRE-family HTH domain
MGAALAERTAQGSGKKVLLSTQEAREMSRVVELHTSVALTQDPHAIRDTRENVLEIAIGREVRAFRKKLGITVADLAAATNISLGMLSKIENGNTSPSLTTLQSLSRALGVPVTAFLRRFEQERNAVFVKAGEGVDVQSSRPCRVKHLRGRGRALSHHAERGFRHLPDLPA